MFEYVKRLLTAGAAYQTGDIVAKAFAVFTLPLYTRHVSTGGYGRYQALLSAIIFFSILLRFGVGEAFVRFYYDDADPGHRRRLTATASAFVVWTTTPAALAFVAAGRPLSQALLGHPDTTLFDLAVLGLWAFTNLEVAYAQLRVDERKRTYLRASLCNVLLTVTLTLSLVVFAGLGARGLMLGNFGASTAVLLGLWWVLRERISFRPGLLRWARQILRPMLAFGLPTVPADLGVYAVQVVDRFYLLRVVGQRSAGLYSIALSLATVVFLAVRGFQYAWPPLAYSIDSDGFAARLYALVTTYYVLGTGVVVAAVALVGRWLVRLLAAPSYFGAHRALPWLALGWALYGLFLIFVVISGRVRATRRNLPATLAGLVVNVGLLTALVPHGGLGLGISGAGIALCGAYATMLILLHMLTRSLFPVRFEWGRILKLVAILASVAVSGELLLPTHGLAGLALRVLWLGLIPLALALTRFFHSGELRGARSLLRMVSLRA